MLPLEETSVVASRWSHDSVPELANDIAGF